MNLHEHPHYDLAIRLLGREPVTLRPWVRAVVLDTAGQTEHTLTLADGQGVVLTDSITVAPEIVSPSDSAHDADLRIQTQETNLSLLGASQAAPLALFGRDVPIVLPFIITNGRGFVFTLASRCAGRVRVAALVSGWILS